MSKLSTSCFYSINTVKQPDVGPPGEEPPPPPPPPPPPSGQAIKFHHGFYLTPLAVPWSTVLSQVSFAPCIRGVQMRWTWREMEGAQGDYSAGFAEVDQMLADLSAINKRLVLFFETRSTSLTDRALAADVVPNYVKNSATYEFGQLLYDSNVTNLPAAAGGKIIKLFNANIRTRLAAMCAAYGARYNGHPNFEGIGITEASIPTLLGTPGTDYPTDFEQQFPIGTYKCLEAMKSTSPNTMVYLFCNYKRDMIRKLIDGGTFGAGTRAYTIPGLTADRMAIGSPNTKINEYGIGGLDTSKSPPVPQPPDVGIFDHFRGNAGVVPIMPSWQRPDYEFTSYNTANPLRHVPTIQELYDFSKNSLKANYIFVTPATATASNPTDYWQAFKNWLNANPTIRDSLGGGLIGTKPTSYPGIIVSTE